MYLSNWIPRWWISILIELNYVVAVTPERNIHEMFQEDGAIDRSHLLTESQYVSTNVLVHVV